MKIVYLDCSTGVSGDMLLASLSDALEQLHGPEHGVAYLEQELNRLGLDGFGLDVVEKRVGGIRTKHVDVLQTKDQPLRTLSNLTDIIEKSGLNGTIAERSLSALTLLGQAEAKVHGVDIESIHFHEIGAVDTIVDIVGVMVLMEAIGAEKLVCSPIDLGSGFVECAHGRLPVPAPACAELAKELITFGSDCEMERATPTGLAILRTIANDCGSMPMGRLLATGYGSGTRSSDTQPTYVRAMILESLAVDMPDQGENRA